MTSDAAAPVDEEERSDDPAGEWGPDGFAGGASDAARAVFVSLPVDEEERSDDPAGEWGPDGFAGGARGARAPLVV